MSEPKFTGKTTGKTYAQLLKEKAATDKRYKSYVTPKGTLAPEPPVTELRKLNKMKFQYGNPFHKPING